MTPAQQKERAVEFLAMLENPDPAKLEALVADNFEWRVMTRMPGFAPVKGKDALKGFAKGLKTMMPNGLNMKWGTVFSEGNNVSVQCESNTTAANGAQVFESLSFLCQLRRRQDRAGARVLRYQPRARGLRRRPEG